MMHQPFALRKNKKVSGLSKKSAQISPKVKSLVHLFKGGRGQGGGATLSLLASSEIRSLAA